MTDSPTGDEKTWSDDLREIADLAESRQLPQRAAELRSEARRLEATENCGTCLHWRQAVAPYDHCTVRNVREGWGDLRFMPAAADEWCTDHESPAHD